MVSKVNPVRATDALRFQMTALNSRRLQNFNTPTGVGAFSNEVHSCNVGTIISAGGGDDSKRGYLTQPVVRELRY